MTSLPKLVEESFPDNFPQPEESDDAEAAGVPMPDGIAGKRVSSQTIPIRVGTAEGVTSRDEADGGNRLEPSSSQSHEGTEATETREVSGFSEIIRGADGDWKFPTYKYSVSAGVARDFGEMVAREGHQRDPLRGMPLPACQETYGTTGELFARVKGAIAEQTHYPNKDSALLTFWAFSTWFKEVLSVAPCLIITGRAQDGENALRTLRAFCSRPVLMAGMTNQNLNRIRWGIQPTLLISEPNLSKRMAALLGCSTCRGYLALMDNDSFDYFCPKAIYLGEDLPMKSMPQHCVHIIASATLRVESHQSLPLSEEMTQSFQNQLLSYRLKSIGSVFKSDFSASGLSPESNAIANALGKCIVDAPDLQKELVSLLAPHSQQHIAESLDDLGTLTVGAAFDLCHQGKTQILVGDIAAEVNRILRDRGERLYFSAEKVGHKLKKIGLLSQRLGGAGNGFLLDHSTKVLLHEIAASYGFEGRNSSPVFRNSFRGIVKATALAIVILELGAILNEVHQMRSEQVKNAA